MASDSTLYFSAVEDMFKEVLTIGDDDRHQHPGNEEFSETPKRCVHLRQQKLFANDSASFVIGRRAPRTDSKIDLKGDMSPGRRRELRGEEVLRMRKDRAEKERMRPQRRLTMRI
ncbi:uncharacterized protein LOC6534484 [Drosophila yakuba]|uniref:Uncharacterized protein n=1 Tax=Drosophila yakuba TaxID=7245 RepID=B4IU05_DROYA|nr:uncharacterized protein LOC6534484 [Drosophila yakuba]EDW99868.1 uncharacterized protein Dyak_GE22846 [Drosophila yakuba]